jgi:RNA polymerase sigma factor (sigma-70 family)
MTGGRIVSTDCICAVRQYLLYRAAHQDSESVDAELWDRFFREQQTIVSRVAYRSGVTHVEAEDCIQQTWLELLTRLPQLEPNGDPDWLRRWLIKVVRSKLSKLSDQKRRKRRHIAVSLDNCAHEMLSYEHPCSEALESRELKRVMRRGLVLLRRQVARPTYRVVRMRFLRGLTVNEVCHALALSRQQVWDRQRIGLRKLERILRRLGCDGWQSLR